MTTFTAISINESIDANGTCETMPESNHVHTSNHPTPKSEKYDWNQDNSTHNTLTCRQVNNLVEYMTQNHSKALFLRFDLMNSTDASVVMEREHITGILLNTKRALERKFKNSPNKLDMHYVWTTEQSANAEHPHYHLFIGVNGHALRNGYAVMAAMQPYVQRIQQTENDGLVHFSESNGTYGIMCDRNKDDFDSQKERAIDNGMYLAKQYSKEDKPKGARFSSASHLPSTNPQPVQS